MLVSEVMLQQTQVSRVEAAWPAFVATYPTPASMAAASAGDVIRAWGRLGYPRRARRLWEAANAIHGGGWPDDLRELPGVGRYTAGAVAAQADGVDVPAVEVNIRRVVERVEGRILTEREAERVMMRIGRGMAPRDRLLALMDVGARICTARDPACVDCPLRRRCATRGVLTGERKHRQSRFAGSFRQRRGEVLAELRTGPADVGRLDAAALASLAGDGLAVVEGTRARLP